jgi:hypothetical protein
MLPIAAPTRARFARSARFSVFRRRERRLARLLDGPVVTFVAVAAQLIARLAALRVDPQRREVLGRERSADAGHGGRRDQRARVVT